MKKCEAEYKFNNCLNRWGKMRDNDCYPAQFHAQAAGRATTLRVSIRTSAMVTSITSVTR
ncbi:hypothetical protein JOJ88_003314 [Pantoea cypripedii]|nr:hypothetical protein [Pantoea cypripedii]